VFLNKLKSNSVKSRNCWFRLPKTHRLALESVREQLQSIWCLIDEVPIALVNKSKYKRSFRNYKNLSLFFVLFRCRPVFFGNIGICFMNCRENIQKWLTFRVSGWVIAAGRVWMIRPSPRRVCHRNSQKIKEKGPPRARSGTQLSFHYYRPGWALNA